MSLNVLPDLLYEPMAFEVVRDRIAAILVAELANQATLAAAVPSIPASDYQITVTIERSFPWVAADMPLINVTYADGQIDQSSSPVGKNQSGEHTYNIDCYAVRPSTVDGTTIEEYADVATALETHRIARLVYQILMADINAFLQFPCTVSKMVGGPVTAVEADFQAVTDGSFVVSVDGESQVVDSLDFSAATTFGDIAAVISAGITGANCTWDEVLRVFTITSDRTGKGSAVSALSTHTSGTDISGALYMDAQTGSATLSANAPIGFIGYRIIKQMTPFQMSFGDDPANNVLAFRVPLVVKHAETVPQSIGDTLEGIDLTIRRSDSTVPVDIEMEIDT